MFARESTRESRYLPDEREREDLRARKTFLFPAPSRDAEEIEEDEAVKDVHAPVYFIAFRRSKDSFIHA